MNIGLVDLSFNLILAFAVLFVIVLTIIGKKESTPTTNTLLENPYMIKIVWNENVDADVDLWVKFQKQLVGFRNPQSTNLFLDHDDTGSSIDTLVSDGVTYVSPINQEILYIKQRVDGRYIANVHFYKNRAQIPITVQAELIQMKPNFRVLKSVSVDIDTNGEQKTLFIFEIVDGEVDNILTDVNENIVYNNALGYSIPGGF